MNDSLFYFIYGLEKPPKDIGKYLIDHKDSICQKGYGTPELEIKYMHQIFSHIQRSHPEFKSFSWEQCNSYNDNYYHFQLASFTVNDDFYVDSDLDFYFEYFEGEKLTSDISFDPVEFPDPEEKAFAKSKSIEIDKAGLPHEHLDSFFEFIKKKYKHLEIPCLKFLAFLKLLEINFSMYYFLYSFGNVVTVRFDKEGVTVKKENEKDLEGSPLGDGMELEE